MSHEEIQKEKQKKKYIYPAEKIKEYNQRYYQKNNYEITCDICFKKYTGVSKSYHPNSKTHLMALQLLQSLTTSKDS
jgi:hypothetical protein